MAETNLDGSQSSVLLVGGRPLRIFYFEIWCPKDRVGI